MRKEYARLLTTASMRHRESGKGEARRTLVDEGLNGTKDSRSVPLDDDEADEA